MSDIFQSFYDVFIWILRGIGVLIVVGFVLNIFKFIVAVIVAVTSNNNKEKNPEEIQVVAAQNLLYFQIFSTTILAAILPLNAGLFGFWGYALLQMFSLLFVWQVGKARNWARWAVLIFFELGLVSSFDVITRIFSMPFWTMIFYMLDIGLPFVALLILFFGSAKQVFNRESNKQWRYITVGIILNVICLYGVWIGKNDVSGVKNQSTQNHYDVKDLVASTLKIYRSGGLSDIQLRSAECYSKIKNDFKTDDIKECVVVDITAGIVDGYMSQKYQIPPSEYFSNKKFSSRAGPFFVKMGVSGQQTNVLLKSWFHEAQAEISSGDLLNVR